jgi:endonuclease YncB( thermonuclease family)
MRRLLFAGLLVGLAVVASTAGSADQSAQPARDPKEIQALLEQLQRIPEGSRVRVQFVDGKTLEAQLLDVTTTSIRVLPKDASSDRVIPLDQVKRVQRVKHGSLAKKIVLWTGVGFLALIGIGVATCAAG